MENQHPNQILIEAISDKVAEQNQQFASFCQAFNDYRQKGQFLTQYYPWPIGQEIRRLIDGDHLSQDDERIRQIFRVTEKSIQFLSFCLLADLWNNIENTDVVISPAIQEHIKQLTKPSMGTWVGVLRSAFKILKEVKEGVFFDYDTINQKKIIYFAEQLVEHRNGFVHKSEDVNFEIVEELLVNLLQKLSFLTNYKMITVKDIRVFSPRFSSPRFQHTFSLLNSMSANFTGEIYDFPEFTESHSVLLMQDHKQPNTYLNLYPFVIDTSPFIDNDKKITKGVFMYVGNQNNKLEFSGTLPPINVNFNDFNLGKDILEKLELFFNRFAI